MAILWGRYSGGDGKISNQGENTKVFPRKENPAAEVAWVSALLLTGCLFLSDSDKKTLLSPACHRPPRSASAYVSTSDFCPLLADRQLEQRAPSLPTWLSGQCLGSALSLQEPSWDTFSDTTGGCCLGIPSAPSGIKPQTPHIWVLHLRTCLPFIYQEIIYFQLSAGWKSLLLTLQDTVFPLTISVSSLQWLSF